MIIKHIPYIVNQGSWATGIAISNFSGKLLRVGAEYSDKDDKVVLERSYAVHGILRFLFPKEGIFKAVFFAEGDFDLTWAVKMGNIGWEVDYCPTKYSPPLSENKSIKMVALPDTYYMSIAGQLKYITERAGTSLKWICRSHYCKTGFLVKVLDLNGDNKDNKNLHPKGTHIFEDGDFEYEKDLSITWSLMKDLIDPFPESFIQTHETKVWPNLVKVISPIELDKYKSKFLLDTNRDWNHDKHFHWHKGG